MQIRPIIQESLTEQSRLRKRLIQSNSKLSSVCGLATYISLFSTLSLTEIPIHDGDASPDLILAFVISTCLLIVTTVFIRIAACWIMPQFETAAFLSRHTIEELDQIPHEELLFFMDLVWMLGTLISFSLFLVNFVLIAWINFQHFTSVASYGATIIMAPLLFGVLILAVVFYKNMAMRNGQIRAAKRRRKSSIALGIVVHANSSITDNVSSLSCDCEFQIQQMQTIITSI